jgi:DHA2 family multidrug resistance protein-like MFS transporter
VLLRGPVALVLTDALVAFGTGPLFALGTGLVVGSVAPERAGSAAALAEVSNYLGGTVGITVFGTIAAAVYQSRLHDAPAEARESVAAATDAAHALPPAAAHRLLDGAHAAFGSGITVIAVAGLVVFAVLTLVCRRTASA